jgi:deoxycytidine triphosphate deaminase
MIKQLCDDKGLIHNADLDHCLAPASYEMRIGSYRHMHERRELNPGEAIEIPPHSLVLTGTIETVHLPLDILGLLYLRSTYARLALMPWFQGLVDPGYPGALTVVLHNVTCQPVTISYGERVCHLVFERLLEAAEHPYSGSYVESLGAAPAVKGAAARIIRLERAESD